MARTSSAPCSTPTTPRAPPPTSASPPPRPTAASPAPTAAMSTGSSSTAAGRPSSPRSIDDHPRVAAYAKNHNLGLEVPYLREGEPHRYRPDFLVRLDDGTPLTLVLEVKGFRGHDAVLKAPTMRDKWVPAVNRLAASAAGPSPSSAPSTTLRLSSMPPSTRPSPRPRRRPPDGRQDPCRPDHP